MIKRLLIVVFVLLLFLGNNSLADDGYFHEAPQSGALIPVNNNYIQMVSEEVIYSNKQFTTIFVFVNTSSEEQNVTLGFPVIGDFEGEGVGEYEAEAEQEYYESLPENKKKEFKMKKIKEYYRFRSFINGTEVNRELVEVAQEKEKGGYDYIYLTKLRFGPKQRIIVTNVYYQEPIRSATAGYSGNSTIKYILTTGALWKSNIEKANITFYIDKSVPNKVYSYMPKDYAGETEEYEGAFIKDYVKSAPNYTKVEEYENYYLYTWSLQNIEPQQDIEFSWGFTREELDLKMLSDIIKRINQKQVGIAYEKYKDFFIEMQRKMTYSDYIRAVSECKINKGIKRLDIPAQFLINSIYALNGYQFKSQEWTDYFSRFKWYDPNTNEPNLSKAEKRLIQELKNCK